MADNRRGFLRTALGGLFVAAAYGQNQSNNNSNNNNNNNNNTNTNANAGVDLDTTPAVADPNYANPWTVEFNVNPGSLQGQVVFLASGSTSGNPFADFTTQKVGPSDLVVTIPMPNGMAARTLANEGVGSKNFLYGLRGENPNGFVNIIGPKGANVTPQSYPAGAGGVNGSINTGSYPANDTEGVIVRMFVKGLLDGVDFKVIPGQSFAAFQEMAGSASTMNNTAVLYYVHSNGQVDTPVNGQQAPLISNGQFKPNWTQTNASVERPGLRNYLNNAVKAVKAAFHLDIAA